MVQVAFENPYDVMPIPTSTFGIYSAPTVEDLSQSHHGRFQVQNRSQKSMLGSSPNDMNITGDDSTVALYISMTHLQVHLYMYVCL